MARGSKNPTFPWLRNSCGAPYTTRNFRVKLKPGQAERESAPASQTTAAKTTAKLFLQFVDKTPHCAAFVNCVADNADKQPETATQTAHDDDIDLRGQGLLKARSSASKWTAITSNAKQATPHY